VIIWKLVYSLVKPLSDSELERNVQCVRAMKKYFGVCEQCGERMARGHLCENVCHSCMEKEGVAF
jgi:methionyl-tRNA synthetase